LNKDANIVAILIIPILHFQAQTSDQLAARRAALPRAFSKQP
jgi:hypothetical protein